MKKTCLALSLFLFLFFSAHSQLMVAKRLGKNESNSKLGYGVFAYIDFPLGDYENRSFRIELLDFAFFGSKNDSLRSPIGYLSIKLGYKYIFSETKTGFYIEPQAGYCRVVTDNPYDLTNQASYGDGVALAFEAGYSLEVGQRGHVINFGIKYEDDIARTPNTMGSVGFRISYAFNMFRKKESY
ncbi:MAG TPA: hypothetical protein VMT76_05535 [Puia sp.]|nr:hypothetical protein [Puia sp.]